MAQPKRGVGTDFVVVWLPSESAEGWSDVYS